MGTYMFEKAICCYRNRIDESSKTHLSIHCFTRSCGWSRWIVPLNCGRDIREAHSKQRDIDTGKHTSIAQLEWALNWLWKALSNLTNGLQEGLQHWSDWGRCLAPILVWFLTGLLYRVFSPSEGKPTNTWRKCCTSSLWASYGGWQHTTGTNPITQRAVLRFICWGWSYLQRSRANSKTLTPLSRFDSSTGIANPGTT